MNNKSKKNKRYYFLFKTVEILSAALIPFLAIFHNKTKPETAEWFTITTAALGVLIVILNGVNQLMKYYDNWLRYRTTVETLTKEKYLFLSRTAPYNIDEAYNKFVENAEAILNNEKVKWLADMTRKTGNADDKAGKAVT